jgi:hypothetical protein
MARRSGAKKINKFNRFALLRSLQCRSNIIQSLALSLINVDMSVHGVARVGIQTMAATLFI